MGFAIEALVRTTVIDLAGLDEDHAVALGAFIVGSVTSTMAATASAHPARCRRL